MFISFIKDSEGKISVKEYEINSNEYYFENKDYQLFIDSNLPIDIIEKLCNAIKNDGVDKLVEYLKDDGSLLLYDKKLIKLSVMRDQSGLTSLYYSKGANELIFSSNSHSIARQLKLPLLKSSIIQFLNFDFLWDGQTFYQNLDQLLMGQTLIFSDNFEIKSNKIKELVFSDKENSLNEVENILKLRAEIVQAHSLYVRQKNVVFLSGGIDSVAMLIALDDLLPKNKIECHSFKVKGTEQDETIYAKSIAEHLEIDLKIIERDLKGEITLEIFRKKLKNLNNPYPGIWIFANQIKNDKNEVYFAGQDTRLHTPALNLIDKLAFKLFGLTARMKFMLYFINFFIKPFQLLFDFFADKGLMNHRFLKGFRRLSYSTDTKKYLLMYYLKYDRVLLNSQGLPKKFQENISQRYQLNLTNIVSERALYNYIVSIKWKEQYVNDIRYMCDMVKEQGGRLAMPFYNMRLAFFSSSIPFVLSNKSITGKDAFSDKKIKINKFVLRQSLKDKIDNKTYSRAKAVSSTFHIIFNQAFTTIIRQLIESDLKHPSSLIKQMDLTAFVNSFLKRNTPYEINDESYLLKIYNLCSLIVYAEDVEYKLV